MKTLQKIFVIFTFSLVALFTACSTQSANVQLVEQIAITYGVAKIIEKNPALAPRIYLIAEQVEVFASGDTSFTVTELRKFIVSKINFANLSKADRDLVNILLDQIDLRLREKIDAGAINPEKLVTVRQFALWVKTAATP